jgi:hypothetical protein
MTDLSDVHSELYGPRDSLCHEGARELAFRLREYWAMRGGHAVTTSLQHEVYGGRLGVYGIRSDMIGGFPRSYPLLSNSAAGQRAAAD